MPQITVQQALSEIEDISLKYGSVMPGDVPLRKLLRPWLVITDLNVEDALILTAGEIWTQLSEVRQGLLGYMMVMAKDTDSDQLQEAACRLIGEFNLGGEKVVEGKIVMVVQQKNPIRFESGVWNYCSDPAMRLMETAPTFREAVAAIRRNASE